MFNESTQFYPRELFARSVKLTKNTAVSKMMFKDWKSGRNLTTLQRQLIAFFLKFEDY